jgi:pimeloyl-ACP methyl ester carboxylesterase
VAFFRAFTDNIYFEPAPILNALHIPVLVILGVNDDVVEPSTTIAVLDRLRAEGHDVTYRVYPGVGHLLLVTSPTGQIIGYPDGYLDLITHWARERVGRLRQVASRSNARANAETPH